MLNVTLFDLISIFMNDGIMGRISKITLSPPKSLLRMFYKLEIWHECKIAYLIVENKVIGA